MASGTLLIESTNCNWTGGNLEVASGAILQLAPGSGNGITLTGTYTGSGGGQVQLTGGTLIIGTAGATFDFPQGLFQWTGGTINGSGTLTNAPSASVTVQPAAAGSLTLAAAAFAAGGTIQVKSGTLLLADSTVTGSNVSFTVAAEATVNLSGPTYTGSFAGSGGGTVGFGTLSVGSGGATFNFPAGMFLWNGGFIHGPGSLTNTGAMTLNGATDGLTSGAVLVNSGTLTVTGNGEALFGGLWKTRASSSITAPARGCLTTKSSCKMNQAAPSTSTAINRSRPAAWAAAPSKTTSVRLFR